MRQVNYVMDSNDSAYMYWHVNLCKFVKCLQLHVWKKWKFDSLHRNTHKLLRKSSNSPPMLTTNQHSKRRRCWCKHFRFHPISRSDPEAIFWRSHTHRTRRDKMCFLQCNKRWIDSRKISITEIIFIFFLTSFAFAALRCSSCT